MLDEEVAVQIDYSLNMEQMILADRYDHVGPFLRNNEPIQGRISGNGIVTANLALVHIDRIISTDGALSAIQNLKLVPAGLEHLLAFALERPDLQRQIFVAALGSIWQRATDSKKDDRCAPFIWGDVKRRCLSLHWIGMNWPDKYYRFLAVRPTI